jgi:hypothetical protein
LYPDREMSLSKDRQSYDWPQFYCSVVVGRQKLQRLLLAEHADGVIADASMLARPGGCTDADEKIRAPLGASWWVKGAGEQDSQAVW